VSRAPLVLALGGLLAAHSAWADQSSFHATASGDVAASDNVFSAEDNREGDVYMQVRPGVLWVYASPRMIHELTAELEVLEYATHNNDKPSLNERASWRGVFLPGPRSDLALGASGSTGQVSALTANSSPDQTTVLVQPAGQVDVRQAEGSEYAGWLATQELRLTQQGFVRWASTDDNAMMRTTTETFEAGGGLGVNRRFQNDTVGIDAGVSFLRLERLSELTGPGLGNRLDRQVNPRGTITWRHDLSRQWSTNATGGVVYVNPIGHDPYNPTDPRLAGWFPIFSGVVAYTDVWGHATIDVHRSVAPNQFVAQNTVNDGVLTQVGLPLPWLDDNPHAHDPKLVGLASLGLERTQLVDPSTGSTVGSFQLARIDVGAAWNARPGQTWGVRYELAYQHGDTTAMMTTPSFYRNTLFFTFTLRYPERVSVRVPRRTQSLRSDRSDVNPIGTEPVIPGGLPGGDN